MDNGARKGGTITEYRTNDEISGDVDDLIAVYAPLLVSDAYDEKCPWDKSQTLEDWISERVLKLTCTADDMRPLAKAAGFQPGVWKWREPERAQLRAELDAAYFHLYGLPRDDVDYILGTFQGIAHENEKADGEGETRRLIFEAYDAMV